VDLLHPGRRPAPWVTRVSVSITVLAVLAALAMALALPATGQARDASTRSADAAGLPEVVLAALPAEARATLVLIRAGGPFPFDRDGIVFANREKRLPMRARGYYREYTVKTPGVRTRGARRIVTGQAGELYYSDDHYDSFRRVRE